jgi:sulfopropanediol 3-dehydrogenase
MSVGTAKVAGVDYIIACAPPRDQDGMYPYTLYALHESGADEIYHLGGVQAMASMAYGCIGMQAGGHGDGRGQLLSWRSPSASSSAPWASTSSPDRPRSSSSPTRPRTRALVATDLLGQAEHGPDSPAWLVTTSRKLGPGSHGGSGAAVEDASRPQAIAGVAWRDNGEGRRRKGRRRGDRRERRVRARAPGDHDRAATTTTSRSCATTAASSSARKAPWPKATRAWGTNHTLPTSRAARYTGGLWVGKFLKVVTYQRLSKGASHAIAPVISRVCEAEGMLAHQITADVREKRYA